MNKNIHVVVLMGGWSSEREVSLTSGKGVAAALRERRWSNVTELDMGRDVAARLVLRSGEVVEWPLDQLGYTYRRSEVPTGAVVIEATLRGIPGDPEAIGAEMEAIARAREESQPLRSRTGGSTFKNPPGHKAWALIDAAGCRGFRMGDVQVSEKHCNFLLNLGSATSAEIEALGEEVRRRVEAKTHISLEWEIQRVGTP